MKLFFFEEYRIEKTINDGLDEYTIKHGERVAEYTSILYKLAIEKNLYVGRLSKEELAYIKRGVKYHDVGKKYISNEILNKKGKLTFEEYGKIKKHVEYGIEIVDEIFEMYNVKKEKKVYFEVVMKAILEHHERYDGTGYPRGLRGKEISSIGQMCALCDYYDALTSHRAYKLAFTHDEAIANIIEEEGKMFNPELVKLFVENQKVFQNQLKLYHVG